MPDSSIWSYGSSTNHNSSHYTVSTLCLRRKTSLLKGDSGNFEEHGIYDISDTLCSCRLVQAPLYTTSKEAQTAKKFTFIHNVRSRIVCYIALVDNTANY